MGVFSQMSGREGGLPKTIETVHKSVVIPVKLDQKVGARLVKERRTFSDVVRDALEAYASAK